MQLLSSGSHTRERTARPRFWSAESAMVLSMNSFHEDRRAANLRFQPQLEQSATISPPPFGGSFAA
jgi:hypothetical protein